MDKNQLVKIIEGILNYRERQVLVVITGGDCYQKEIFSVLQKFQEVRYQYIMTPAAEAISTLGLWKQIGDCIENFEQMQSAVHSADCIVIPALTRNSLAKSACGIADNLALNAIQLALMSGKPVIASESCWNPEGEKSKLKKISQNHNYNDLLFSYRSRLCSFGMQSVPAYKLEEVLLPVLSTGTALPKDSSREDEQVQSGIITKENLFGKKSVCIREDAKFTDLAKEYISQNSIEIRHQ